MQNSFAKKSNSAVESAVKRQVEAGFGATDLWLLLMTIIWGANFTFIKYSLDEMLPLSFTGLRFILASVAMLVVLLASGRDLKVSRADLWRLFGLGLLSNTFYQPFFILGMSNTRAGNAALILATAPFFTALIGRVRRQEYFAPRGVAGLVLAFIGMTLIIVSGHKEFAFVKSILGDGLLICATICWSLYTVGAKRMVHTHGAMKATTLMMITGTPALLVVCAPALWRQDWSTVGVAAWSGVTYSALLAIAFAYIIWNHGVRKIGPTRTAVYSNLTPIVALIVAWPALGEVPTLGQVAGAAIIFVGIYLVRRGMLHPEPHKEIIDEIDEASLRPGKN